jgi:hypothetical protein
LIDLRGWTPEGKTIDGAFVRSIGLIDVTATVVLLPPGTADEISCAVLRMPSAIAQRLTLAWAQSVSIGPHARHIYLGAGSNGETWMWFAVSGDIDEALTLGQAFAEGILSFLGLLDGQAPKAQDEPELNYRAHRRED